MSEPNWWKDEVRPLAGRIHEIRCDLALSAEDLAVLRAGLWPLDMDDRWVVWLADDDVLRCWRSWTRDCVYEAQVLPSGDGGATITQVRVADDPETYHRASRDREELERLQGVIDIARRGTSPSVTW